MDHPNPFDILGVSTNSTDSQVKHAYLKLIKKYHPDVNKSKDATQRTQEIVNAYLAIKTKIQRQRYAPRNNTSSQTSQSKSYAGRYAYEYKKRQWNHYPFTRPVVSWVKSIAIGIMKYAMVVALIYLVMRMVYTRTNEIITAPFKSADQNTTQSANSRPQHYVREAQPENQTIKEEIIDPNAPLKAGDLVNIRVQTPLILLGKAKIIEINQNTITVSSHMNVFTFQITNINMERNAANK